jgi:CheY-like chemotaxis protein
MDGLAATRLFKAQPATREVPVVALTASAMEEDAARAKEAGCDGYMTKPCGQALLLEAVRRAIARQPADTAATASRPSAP